MYRLMMPKALLRFPVSIYLSTLFGSIHPPCSRKTSNNLFTSPPNLPFSFTIFLMFAESVLYISREFFALDEHIVVRYIFMQGRILVYCEFETGIAPLVAHLAAIRSMRGELQALGPSLVKKFEEMLDDWIFGGVLSESQMDCQGNYRRRKVYSPLVEK